MTVFIGWAGETSRKIASILRNWLAGMFDNHINIFAPDNLSAGSLWSVALHEALTTADCGLLCLTADNVNSPWLTYEAGALSQNVKALIPILFGVNPILLGEPLYMFQSVSFGFDGMWELTVQLNQLYGDNRIPLPELERKFRVLYPTLEMLLKAEIPEHKPQLGNLERAISAVDSKLDAILSQLSELKQKSVPSNPPRLNQEVGL